MAIPNVKALTFDVFGTVVDWRSSIIREGEALGRAKGITDVDWAAFADAWRGLYQPIMDRVSSGASPWTKLDPNAKITFEGPSSSTGTIMNWAGNNEVGEGKMTLTESKLNELVKINVDIVKPMEGSSTTEFAFKPDGDKTAVTWSMTGHHNFIAKATCLVMNGRRMMFDIMDKGLANMKSVVEGASKT